jgi:hypothetical protein
VHGRELQFLAVEIVGLVSARSFVLVSADFLAEMDAVVAVSTTLLVVALKPRGVHSAGTVIVIQC